MKKQNELIIKEIIKLKKEIRKNTFIEMIDILGKFKDKKIFINNFLINLPNENVSNISNHSKLTNDLLRLKKKIIILNEKLIKELNVLKRALNSKRCYQVKFNFLVNLENLKNREIKALSFCIKIGYILKQILSTPIINSEGRLSEKIIKILNN